MICSLFFVCVASIFTQEITYYLEPSNNKFTQFERSLIETIVDLNNKNASASKITLKEKNANFGDILNLIKKTNASENLIGINTFSINDERKKVVDFSSPYMANTYAIIGIDSNLRHQDVNAKKLKYGFIKETIYADITKKLSTKHGFKSIEFNSIHDLKNALLKKQIDFMISDLVDVWTYDLVYIKQLESVEDNLAIIFPKGSPLKEKLDPIIKYFVKSPAYYNLIKKHFGDDALTYFKQKQKK